MDKKNKYINTEMAICKHCGKEFSRDLSAPRKQIYCDKKCGNLANYYKHKNKYRKKQKEYHNKNKDNKEFKDKNNTRFKKWLGNNKERHKEIMRKNYEKNKEKRLQYSKEYHKAHANDPKYKEQHRETSHEWYLKNKGKLAKKHTTEKEEQKV